MSNTRQGRQRECSVKRRYRMLSDGTLRRAMCRHRKEKYLRFPKSYSIKLNIYISQNHISLNIKTENFILVLINIYLSNTMKSINSVKVVSLALQVHSKLFNRLHPTPLHKTLSNCYIFVTLRQLDENLKILY